MSSASGTQPAESGVPRPATLADVAAAADVSTSTVSRALRDSPLVSDATRERVQEIAVGIGFEPNRLARSLRTRSSMFVGVVVPDVAIAFYAAALKGAQDVLERAGYQVLVMNTEREASRETASLRTLRAHRVDGLLVATSGGFSGAGGTPVVFFDQLADGEGLASVSPANREGVALLVDHLVEHGHTRIGYVGAPPGLTSSTERLEGFRTALERHGLGPGAVELGDVLWSEESGDRATQELLAAPDPPTAIVAAGDTLALGALRALRGCGLTVPDDVALVSFDDPASGDLLDPPVTALSSHAAELGGRSAGLLLEALAGRLEGEPISARISLELIVRRSCGCSPR